MSETDEELSAALWRGIGGAEDALFPAKVAEIKALATAYIKRNVDAPWALAWRARDKKGKPTRSPDAGRVLAWAKALPALLEREVAAGRAIGFRADKKGARGYLPAPVRQARQELADIARMADAMHERLQALRSVIGGGPAPADPEERLHAAYRGLDVTGRGYVPIHRLRAEAGLARAEFDALLRHLRRQLVVDLQVGTPSDYERRELEDALLEPDGTLYLTLTWRGA